MAKRVTKTSKKPSFIPLSVPYLSGNEMKYLKECIETSWVSYLGPYVSRMEEQMAKRVGTARAVATNSGTAALHTALLVAGIGTGDEVLVPDLTFIATANTVRYCGAAPVFMDVEPDYWQMDIHKIERFLSEECRNEDGKLINKKSLRTIKAIMPVHLLGHPCDMDRLLIVARKYGLLVIEDCAQSLGTLYKGKSVGGLGDIGCFSYNGNKIITCGGGGMITTHRTDWDARARYLTTQAKDSPIDYVHEAIGYNYRLTNIQAAVGVAQLEKLDSYVKIKRRIASRYEQALGKIPGITFPKTAPWAFATHWLFTIVVDPLRYGKTNRDLQKAMEDQNIQTRALWAPLHEQRPYLDAQAYRIEVTPHLFQNALSLPCSVNLTTREQDRVIACIQHLAAPR